MMITNPVMFLVTVLILGAIIHIVTGSGADL